MLIIAATSAPASSPYISPDLILPDFAPIAVPSMIETENTTPSIRYIMYLYFIIRVLHRSIAEVRSYFR